MATSPRRIETFVAGVFPMPKLPLLKELSVDAAAVRGVLRVQIATELLLIGVAAVAGPDMVGKVERCMIGLEGCLMRFEKALTIAECH